MIQDARRTVARGQYCRHGMIPGCSHPWRCKSVYHTGVMQANFTIYMYKFGIRLSLISSYLTWQVRLQRAREH